MSFSPELKKHPPDGEARTFVADAFTNIQAVSCGLVKYKSTEEICKTHNLHNPQICKLSKMFVAFSDG
jgi:hypothetical protein